MRQTWKSSRITAHSPDQTTCSRCRLAVFVSYSLPSLSLSLSSRFTFVVLSSSPSSSLLPLTIVDFVRKYFPSSQVLFLRLFLSLLYFLSHRLYYFAIFYRYSPSRRSSSPLAEIVRASSLRFFSSFDRSSLRFRDRTRLAKWPLELRLYGLSKVSAFSLRGRLFSDLSKSGRGKRSLETRCRKVETRHVSEGKISF